MQRAFYLLLLLVLGGLTPCRGELSDQEKKLVGEWQYEDKDAQIVARHLFREDGTYTADVRQAGELLRKFDGLWRIEENMIVYSYTADSAGELAPGMVEKDLLVAISDSAYTVETGDHQNRTYFRVKPKQ